MNLKHISVPFLSVALAACSISATGALAAAAAADADAAANSQKPKKKGKAAVEKPTKPLKPAPPAGGEKPKPHPTGYIDTPFLPGDKWRVHDDTRPRPKVIVPGAKYGDAPSDAIVLFDGTNLAEWSKQDGTPANWKVENGYMVVPPRPPKTKGADVWTKKKFGDCQLHIEWATPGEVVSESQGRGNSGVFFGDGRYEVQILDSFKNKSYADGQASALYGWKPPLVNASRKPGEWQTYDIIFEAPRFDKDGKLLKKAYVTILHNGIVTQHRQSYLGATGHKKVAQYVPHDLVTRIKLQDHNNPTRFRNIWIRGLDFSTQE